MRLLTWTVLWDDLGGLLDHTSDAIRFRTLFFGWSDSSQKNLYILPGGEGIQVWLPGFLESSEERELSGGGVSSHFIFDTYLLSLNSLDGGSGGGFVKCSTVVWSFSSHNKPTTGSRGREMLAAAHSLPFSLPVLASLPFTPSLRGIWCCS